MVHKVIVPIVLAFLLGAAITALVHGFLGGIPKKNTFKTKLFKLGGSTVVLIICVWFFNQIIVE